MEVSVFTSTVLKQHKSCFMLICVANVLYCKYSPGSYHMSPLEKDHLQNCILTGAMLVPSRANMIFCPKKWGWKSAFGWNIKHESKWENMGQHRDSRRNPDKQFRSLSKSPRYSRFKTRMTPEFIEFVCNARSKVMIVFFKL